MTILLCQTKDGSPQELIRALSLFSEQGLAIVDYILFAKASSAGDHIFTFDADLNKLAIRINK